MTIKNFITKGIFPILLIGVITWLDVYKRQVVYSADRIEIHFNYEDEISEFVKYAYANSDLVRRKVGEL